MLKYAFFDVSELYEEKVALSMLPVGLELTQFVQKQ